MTIPDERLALMFACAHPAIDPGVRAPLILQTVLGFAWAIIQPAMMMVVFSIFFGGLAKMPSDGFPYPIFVYAALLPWTFFANAITNSANSLVGSANWDPRSLRLNFELDVESFDAEVAAEVDALVEERLARARRITLADVDRRPLALRLRDGVARLFSPYL